MPEGGCYTYTGTHTASSIGPDYCFCTKQQWDVLPIKKIREQPLQAIFFGFID